MWIKMDKTRRPKLTNGTNKACQGVPNCMTKDKKKKKKEVATTCFYRKLEVVLSTIIIHHANMRGAKVSFKNITRENKFK